MKTKSEQYNVTVENVIQVDENKSQTKCSRKQIYE